MKIPRIASQTLWPALLATILACLSACGGSTSASAGTVAKVAVAGDSLTLRTGLCPEGVTLDRCLAEGRASAESSFATYLPQASGGAWMVVANLGRGGDTCTPQAPYASGVFAGQSRGLAGRLQALIDSRPDLAMVLVGINDVAIYGVAPAAVASCVAGVRAALQAAGITVLLLTYPPVAGDSPVYGLRDADARTRALNAELMRIGAVDTSQAWPAWAASIYTTDGVHPAAPGAVAIAAIAARRLP
jgi:lysophospholipase L1-like esterase